MPHTEVLSGQRAYAEDVPGYGVIHDTYEPTLMATTDDPDLGIFGSAAGQYAVYGGHIVWLFFDFLFGSGATAGDGTYLVPVPEDWPIDPAFTASTSIPLVGNVRLRDNSAPNEFVWVPFSQSGDEAGFITLRDPGSPNAQQVEDNNPWTWAVDDRIIGSIWYPTQGV